MTQNKLQVIRSDSGSCLTTLSSFLLMFITFLLWIGISNFVLDRTSVVRQELSQQEWMVAVSFLLGIAFHEFSQYAVLRLLGGNPRYSGRKYDKTRTYFQRKYVSTVILRFWSPGKKFTLPQYLLIVFFPTIVTFGVFPVVMIAWQNPVFHSAIWIIGFANSALIALDIVIALKLVAAGNLNYYVVDELEGTYLVE